MYTFLYLLNRGIIVSACKLNASAYRIGTRIVYLGIKAFCNNMTLLLEYAFVKIGQSNEREQKYLRHYINNAPKGVGVVEWMIPGGAEIALKTSELMKKYDIVVWAHHGLFVMGNDFDSAFGLMHTVEKSAEIYVRMLSMGKPMLQTIPENRLADVAEAYGGKLAENLL